MKRIIFPLLLNIILLTGLHAQMTLEECHRKAQENYPLVVQYDLIEKTKEYNLSNVSKGYLPQFTLSGKATYQSDVTGLPVQISGLESMRLPKDQYQVMLELQQTIWDGGNIHAQKKIMKTSSDVEREQLNVNMYAVNERVNQIYFGILLLDEQLKQNQLLQEDLGRSYQQIKAYMNNGVANQSDLDAVKVEQLNTQQKRTELLSSRTAYYQMLSLLVGENVSPEAGLSKPQSAEPSVGVLNRPELLLYDAQNENLQMQEDALRARNSPRLGLFVQGAYGNPGLNFLKNEFTPYYVAGVRLSWTFGGLYTLRNDKKLITNNRQRVESNRSMFLFNSQLETVQENSSIVSMRTLMKEDDEIITLRNNIRRAAEAKVANGTLTVTEMLREITSENMARQTKALHEIQLLMSIYQLKHTTNN